MYPEYLILHAASRREPLNKLKIKMSKLLHQTSKKEK
jgi:hypothetical protein